MFEGSGDGEVNPLRLSLLFDLAVVTDQALGDILGDMRLEVGPLRI